MIQTRKLHDLFGVEVLGLDISKPLSSSQRDELEQLWRRHQLVLLRDQSLSEQQQLEFTQHYGVLDTVPEKAAQSGENRQVMKIQDDPNAIFLAGITQKWHTDGSYRAVPSYISMLHSLEVPDEGGDTCFTSAIAAYEAMPAELKAKAAGKHMVHAYLHTRFLAPDLPPVTMEDLQRNPVATHPIIRTLPDGRKGLYLNTIVGYFVGGMDVEEGKKFLAELVDWATQDHFVYTHKWRKGDVLIWDNRGLMHRVTPHDTSKTRILQRTEVRGTEYPA